MPRTADFVVIGAGIVGLAVARRLLAEDRSRRVVVLDKEPELGAHASGRNSGVIHAGFYYAPDSHKARLTRRGNQLLQEFCERNDVPVLRCGKVVVARDDRDLERLDILLERGRSNGVPLESITSDDLRELEPLAQTHQRALWSPTTAAADPIGVLRTMAADVTASGGDVRLGEAVTVLGRGWIGTQRDTWKVGHIVNCAGLQADRIARRFGMCDDYVIVPFKGAYRIGNWPVGRLHRHVYPVPDPANPFLGVHVTLTVDGRVKIGPSALPVLGRESYDGIHGVRPSEAGETIRGLTRFLARDAHDSWGLVRREIGTVSHRVLAREARYLLPTVRARDFRHRGRPGIRAQLMDRETGQLEMDFVVRGDVDSTHVLNAVSPAWTSALAFAEWVVDDMRRRGAS